MGVSRYVRTHVENRLAGTRREPVRGSVRGSVWWRGGDVKGWMSVSSREGGDDGIC